jgi:hypothetical protein
MFIDSSAANIGVIRASGTGEELLLTPPDDDLLAVKIGEELLPTFSCGCDQAAG